MNIPDDSNRLPVLCASIKTNLAAAKASDEAGAAARLAVAVELAEARSLSPDNDRKFGAYLKAQGVEMDEHDRAAAIAMGKEPEKFKALLAETHSTSFRYMYAKKWAIFGTCAKDTQSGKNGRKDRKTTPEFEKAAAVYDRRAAAGEPLTMEAIAAEAGISDTPVRRLLTAKKVMESAAKDEDIILYGTAQEKYELKVRAYDRKWKHEFETAVQAESEKRREELSLPSYLKQIAELREALSYKKGLMSRADFNKIRSCLHPDSNGSRSAENLHAAFILFTKFETQLVMDKETPQIKAFHDMPQTKEDLMARRRAK